MRQAGQGIGRMDREPLRVLRHARYVTLPRSPADCDVSMGVTLCHAKRDVCTATQFHIVSSGVGRRSRKANHREAAL